MGVPIDRTYPAANAALVAEDRAQGLRIGRAPALR